MTQQQLGYAYLAMHSCNSVLSFLFRIFYHEMFQLLACRNVVSFRSKIIFLREELLVPRPTLNLEDHPLWSVLDCLLNIFAVGMSTE
jgi:hypothetical protein